MTGQIVSTAQANLKMALWQVDADSMSSSELYAWLVDSGLPHEVTIRLHELASYTKKSGNKVLAVGKIILLKIIEFIKAHPNLAMGVALGAAVGLLVNSVPVLGSVLAPLATVLGITIGAIAGHRLDKGKEVNEGIIGVAQDIIEIARDFFKLFIDIFNAIFRNVITA
ncbi:DUF2273 domain-containing protein [Microcoleus sp. FACHB-53]|nr:DUF2273 domain-containing protein [Microcoleus sp. FACHB-53]